MTLEQLLADTAEQAAILRRHGHTGQADALTAIVEGVRQACPEFMALLSEDAASTYSGRTVAWLRARFPQWVARGLAEQVGPRRYYRRCVLEHRGNANAARAAGRRAAA
jgi:hypothetical protein